MIFVGFEVLTAETMKTNSAELHGSTSQNTVAATHGYLRQCLFISLADNDISTAHYEPFVVFTCEQRFRREGRELLWPV
jgi:hypothetical protein